MYIVIYYLDYFNTNGENIILIQDKDTAKKNGWIEVNPFNPNNIRQCYVDTEYTKNVMIFKFPKRITALKFVEVFKETFLNANNKPLCIIDNTLTEEDKEENI